MEKLINKIKAKLQYNIYHAQLITKLLINNHPTAYVFGAPLQRNMGDQAQTFCISNWIKKNYKNYKVRIIVIPHTTNNIINLIHRNIKKDDKIFFHSGYHITDIYNVLDLYTKCIKTFKDHKIICFPQTINFEDENKLIKTAKTYSSHNDLTLMCRDEKSFKIAKKYFNTKHILLYPDIVTSLIGKYQFNNKRDGVLFCIRNDVESFYSKEQIISLIKKFSCRTKVTDTTITISPYYIVKHRLEIIEQILNYYSTFKVIITDRYHGTIFSLISNTPVIVISSTDHKLSSGVKWFPENIFGKYINFANNLDEAYNIAQNYLNVEIDYKLLPPYFENNYYSKLKDLIDE